MFALPPSARLRRRCSTGASLKSGSPPKASKLIPAPRADPLVVLPLFQSGIGIAITCVLSAGAIRAGALTLFAGVVAVVFGSFIVVVGGFPFLALLALFVVASVLATRYRFEDKKRKNVQEGTHGERGVANVLAHVVVPTGLVAVSWADPSGLTAGTTAFLYTAALAFGAADTFASEFGVLAGRARSLLTGKPVAPGTNGGVSALGEAWAFVGAFTTALVGAGLFYAFAQPSPPIGTFLLGVTLAGFIGCQLDSVLGETLENRHLLDKGGTNLVAMFLTALVAWGLLAVLGSGVP
jgi:uncharacterized protein (TIGR00297 family)